MWAAWIVVLLILSGCLANKTNAASRNDNMTGMSTDNISFDRVVEALNEEGVELLPFGIARESADHETMSPADPSFTGDRELELHQVKPNRFTVGRPEVDQNNVEELYIYIYDSAQSREKGQLELTQAAPSNGSPRCSRTRIY
ncbi:hypothetical protein BCM02_111161 [Paenibacillus methanolicus]|uniref:Uncharacterized protein n=2 Tax=Paenibacillus methanolicus TaxID=582686 RepID=A0A5S5BU07_9BACL|nr:hypothetical protein BCM02_111161 [Paenibacillus methanolicus]